MGGIRANKCGHGEREINKNLSKRDEFIMEKLPGPEKPFGLRHVHTAAALSLSLFLSVAGRASLLL